MSVAVPIVVAFVAFVIFARIRASTQGRQADGASAGGDAGGGSYSDNVCDSGDGGGDGGGD